MAAALRLVVGLVLPVELLEALGFRLGGALVPAAGLHRLPEWPGSPTESSTLNGGKVENATFLKLPAQRCE